jgi:hypothetical protein
VHKLFLLLGFSSLFFSCKKSPEEKAKGVIREQLRTTLHDWKSYESVKWGKLDSALSFYADDPAYKRLIEDFDNASAEVKKAQSMLDIYSGSYLFRDKFNYYMAIAKENLNKMTQDTLLEANFQRDFKPQFIGWQIEHSFRAKNLAGNLGIHHYQYYLDSAIMRVTKSVDISEDNDELKKLNQ